VKSRKSSQNQGPRKKGSLSIQSNSQQLPETPRGGTSVTKNSSEIKISSTGTGDKAGIKSGTAKKKSAKSEEKIQQPGKRREPSTSRSKSKPQIADAVSKSERLSLSRSKSDQFWYTRGTSTSNSERRGSRSRDKLVPIKPLVRGGEIYKGQRVTAGKHGWLSDYKKDWTGIVTGFDGKYIVMWDTDAKGNAMKKEEGRISLGKVVASEWDNRRESQIDKGGPQGNAKRSSK